MSYVPQATYGAYGGMQASPYLSTDVIETQKLDATNALKNQHKLQAAGDVWRVRRHAGV